MTVSSIKRGWIPLEIAPLHLVLIDPVIKTGSAQTAAAGAAFID